jgi:hypothetical protein
MKHLAIYEDFKLDPITQDIFDLQDVVMVLHNRTMIKCPSYSAGIVKELFTDNKQSSLIDSCYYNVQRYLLNESEVKRAECAEKNIREYIGDKLEELDCEIEYYRPMYIDSRGLNNITVCAPFATWATGNELKIKKDFHDRYSEAAKKQIPEIIASIKEFAKKYGVNYVLPFGPVYVERPLNILSHPEDDVEKPHVHFGIKEPMFTPIEKFKWEKWYW